MQCILIVTRGKSGKDLGERMLIIMAVDWVKDPVWIIFLTACLLQGKNEA